MFFELFYTVFFRQRDEFSVSAIFAFVTMEEYIYLQIMIELAGIFAKCRWSIVI